MPRPMRVVGSLIALTGAEEIAVRPCRFCAAAEIGGVCCSESHRPAQAFLHVKDNGHAAESIQLIDSTGGDAREYAQR